MIAVAIVAFTVHEETNESKPHKKMSEFISTAISGLKYIGSNKELKILLPIGMLNQVETILGILWLPWIKNLGGSDLWFSVLATGSYLSRYAVNHYFSKKEKPITFMPRIQTSLLIMALGTLICALTSNVYMALIGVWIMAGARGVFLPATQAIQHDAFPEEIRATGLSMMNFSVEVMIAISYFATSTLIDDLKANTAWIFSMISFLASAFLIYSIKRRLKKKFIF